MDYGHDDIEEEKVDRLSNLPDDLIHKILSFIRLKDTVKTMVLSSRYRSIWTTTPYLNNFSTKENFMDSFLKRRNNQIDVSSLKLDIWKIEFAHPSLKNLMQYAISHNIQQFEVTWWVEEFAEFPLSLLSSQSLTHLNLTMGGYRWASWRDHGLRLKATSTLELPALTTLHLEGVTFNSDDNDNCVVGLFSKCTNLKNLTLKGCNTHYKSSLSICHPGLSNLTLYDIEARSVNVVAPQLENLNVRNDDHDRGTLTHVIISAPNLSSLAYRGGDPLQLSTDGFHSLKKADIRVLDKSLDDAYDDLRIAYDAPQIVGLLQQLHSVKFLTLNLEIIELLSESVELISHQRCPFVNLESLTIYPEVLHDSKSRSRPKGKVNLSTEVRNYLLDSSPGASVTVFSREEIIAERDFASAQKEMSELRVLLEQEKANNIKTYDKGDVNAKKKLQIRGNRALIDSCWKDLKKQVKQRKAKARRIICTLDRIEKLLKELPATKRAIIHERFSSLSVEADTVTRNMLKMHCDEHQSRISVCFQELATTTMEPSS